MSASTSFSESKNQTTTNTVTTTDSYNNTSYNVRNISDSGNTILTVGAEPPSVFGAARDGGVGGGVLGMLTPMNLAIGGAALLAGLYFLRKR